MAQNLAGREKEICLLTDLVNAASEGRGETVIASGEPGIGKTALVKAACEYALSKGFRVHLGAAVREAKQPFNVLATAFAGLSDEPIFRDEAFVSFTEVFAINQAGLLIAKASSSETELDSDIFGGMLTAVQNFVRDSFDATGTMGGTLGRLEYGDMKILIENGRHMFITAVIKSQEHPDMASSLKSMVQEIESKYGGMLAEWSGSMTDVLPIARMLEAHVARRFTVRRDLSSVNLGSEITRMSETALDALENACSEHPVMLVLEDLHWASETSLSVVDYIARNSGNMKLLLLGTARSGESGSFSGFQRRMAAYSHTNEIRLEKLDLSGMRKIIDGRYVPNEFSDDFYLSMFERTEGNPLFALEMASHMESQNAIFRTDGIFRAEESLLALPATIEELVSGRLERLPAGSLDLIETASCIGRDFELSLLPPKTRTPEMEELASAGLITLTDTGGSFCHSIFQDIIYMHISKRWKAIRHRQLGERYESLSGAEPDHYVFELARHFSLAGQHEKTAKYCTKAGEKAESVYALDAALGYYTSSLEANRRLINGKENAAKLNERLGDILQITGKYREADGHFTAAAQTVPEPVTCARMLRKRADLQSKMGDYSLAQQMLDNASEILKGISDPEIGRVHVTMANIRKMRGDFPGALEHIAIAQEIMSTFPENIVDRIQLEKEKGIIFWRRGEQELARTSLEKAAALAEETGDERLAAGIEANLANVLNELGENPKAIKIYESGLARFRKLGDVQAESILLNNLGSMASDSGNIEQAMKYYTESLGIKRRIGDRKGIAYTLNNIGNQLKLTGEYSEAMARFSEARAMLESIGDGVALPITLKNLGDCERSLGHLDAALEHYNNRLQFDRANANRADEGPAISEIAETYLEMGRIGEALEMARQGLDAMHGIENRYDLAAGRRILGMCLREAGDLENAGQEFSAALKIFQELDMAKDVARVQYEMALLHFKAGRISDAKELLNTAARTFRSLGMEHWAGKCKGPA
uniref:Photosystem I assembly protein Ycf3 n=1 Tax=uncultured Thermoplasmata archaeon TaxID=376542 RepID=A0A871YDR3_9ARCH|nr:Tetratricopeptide repeat protein [uncultured Thermoplasmata archaeon]